MSFTVSIVTDEKELKQVYRLRYKVYCDEWEFENPDKHPNGIEVDEFDKHAVHFAVRDDSQKTVGTVRMILNSEEGFPIEKYCEIDTGNSEIPKENIAEISRLAISRVYRRRSEDKYLYGPDEERRIIGGFDRPYNYAENRTHYRRTDDKYKSKPGNPRSRNIHSSERRSRHELVTCLYKAVYHESKRRKLTHWYAVMTKGLIILLNRFAFKFHAIGDPVDYHGIRTAYMGDILKIEEEVLAQKPEIYEEFTKGL